MKLPFAFSLKFVFRLLFPGFFVAIALFPAIRTLCDNLSNGIESNWIIMLSTIMVGWLINVLDMHIYIALEGRRYWPNWLRKIFLNFEKKRLCKLQTKYEQEKLVDRVKYIETSVELRRFPLDDDGVPTVTYPTRLGNLLTAYESYPLRVYGMDSIFYWYRISLVLSEDQREHIDNQQSLVDSSVYMTASLFITGVIVISYAVLEQMPFALIKHLPETQVLLFIGFISIIFSYLIYRSSLHLHASFGELYKSIFDMHRDKVSVDEIVDEICNLTKDKSLKYSRNSEKYIATVRYLHNNRVKTKDGVVSATKLSNVD